MYLTFLISIALSSFISFILTPLFRNFFVSRNWLEDPHKKNQKTQNATALNPVPRGGGLPIFFSILITSILLLPLDRHLTAIIVASFLTLLVGLWDDLKDISPLLRLGTNILASVLVVGVGIGIAYVSNPFGGVLDLSFINIDVGIFGNSSIWLIPALLGVFWITWCMNTVGWAAGVEGQLPGFVSIAAVFIGILGLRYSSDITQWPVIILAGAVAGSYLGFLPFNFYPQSVMPGYSGKSLAGFYLSVLSILSGAKLATLVLLLGIPMLDAIWVIFKRLKNGKSIFHSDASHLHHQLLKIGWSRPQISLFYWSITLLLGLVSLFLNSQQKFYVFLGLAILFFLSILQISRRT